jgi:hypothetical protein
MSTLVKSTDVALMTRACWAQLQSHAAPAWRLSPMPVVYATSAAAAPPGSWVIGVFDDADQAGDLGWHTEDKGVIYGRVFARPVLDNGGDALTKPLSIASVLSHEVLETFVDPSCNRWADVDGRHSIALEVGDPVESDSYAIQVDTTQVTVSNFVTENWFDPQARSGFDRMRRCTAPFQMTRGGYVVQMVDGRVSQRFGEQYPLWRKEMKRSELSRTSRRLVTA